MSAVLWLLVTLLALICARSVAQLQGKNYRYYAQHEQFYVHPDLLRASFVMMVFVAAASGLIAVGEAIL